MSEVKTYTGIINLREAKPRAKRLLGARSVSVSTREPETGDYLERGEAAVLYHPLEGSTDIPMSVQNVSFGDSDTASESADLEVLLVNGVRILHSRLPFVSESFITAGGINPSGPGGSGEDNVIEVVKLNGVALAVVSKAVDVIAVTGIRMNGSLLGVSSGIVDLGTVITEHQSLSNYYKKSEIDSVLDSKQNTISDLATIRSGAAAGALAYRKPSGGIPYSDLASAVQALLDKAETALQSQSLEDYYTQSQVRDLIDAVNQFDYVVASSLPTASADTMYKIYFVPSSNPETQDVKDEYITINTGTEQSPSYAWEKIGSTAIDISGKMDIPSSAAAGNLAKFTSGKQVEDSGISALNLALLNAANVFTGTSNKFNEVIAYGGVRAGQIYSPAANDGEVLLLTLDNGALKVSGVLLPYTGASYDSQTDTKSGYDLGNSSANWKDLWLGPRGAIFMGNSAVVSDWGGTLALGAGTFTAKNHEYYANGYHLFLLNNSGSAADAMKLTAQALLPGANNTLDLGSSSLKWKKLYATDAAFANLPVLGDDSVKLLTSGNWGGYVGTQANKVGYAVNADNASDADKLDNLDSADFVRSTGSVAQNVSGLKTFTDGVRVGSSAAGATLSYNSNGYLQISGNLVVTGFIVAGATSPAISFQDTIVTWDAALLTYMDDAGTDFTLSQIGATSAQIEAIVNGVVSSIVVEDSNHYKYRFSIAEAQQTGGGITIWFGRKYRMVQQHNGTDWKIYNTWEEE